MLTANTPLRAEPYLAGFGFGDYLEHLRHSHPDLLSFLSPQRCRDIERYVAEMNRGSWEFEDAKDQGRGLAYNVAQKSAENRAVGMTTLLDCFEPAQAFRILDVLGGDGTFARFCRNLGQHAPTIYTADIAKFMVDACHTQALPCVRQSATRSLFRDNVLDGV